MIRGDENLGEPAQPIRLLIAIELSKGLHRDWRIGDANQYRSPVSRHHRGEFST